MSEQVPSIPYGKVLEGLDIAFQVNAIKGNRPSDREYEDVTEVAERIGRGVAGSSRLFPNGVPEATIEKAEKWEALPTEYRELVTKLYENKVAAVDGYIEGGLLRKDYRLPELLAFAEQLEELWPAFDYMEKNDWQPRVVFIPRGLNEKEWDYLFKNQKPPDDTVSSDSVGSGFWEIGVMSGAERPVFVDVSKDGSNGPNVARTVDALHQGLSDLSGLSANGTPSVGEVIANASPDGELYLAFQLDLQENGLPPVDLNTKTIGKESCHPTDLNTSGTVVYSFDWNKHKVVLGCQPNNIATSDSGIRPAVLGRDSVHN